MRTTALSSLMALLVTGCVHAPGADLEAARQAAAPRPSSAPVVQRELILAWESPGDAAAAGPAALPPSPLDHPRPDPVPFELGAGYGALGHIDVPSCREQGLLPGYVHVRVTFRRDGRVVRAVLESPAPPPQPALDCVAAKLRGATVPVFDGRNATLSKTFFVEPPAPEAAEDVVVRHEDARSAPEVARAAP